MLLLLAAIAACNKTEGEPEDLFGSASTKPNGSAGGFSAALVADLKGGGSGSGSAGTAGSAAAKPAPVPAGSAAPTTTTPPLPPTTPGSAAAPAPPVANDPPAPVPSVGSATGKTGNIAPPTPTAAPPVGSAAMAAVATKPHVPAKVPPDLAAIQLKMLPRWQRDMDEPGTFLRDLDAVSQQVTFTFHYGYDDPAAPKDRDAYIKFLADKKLLLPSNPDKPLLNRQRGAAWYLEGVDGNGKGAFRYVVLYGDKHLICGGPMYRELGLGDFRDAVIIEAKQICESISM